MAQTIPAGVPSMGTRRYVFIPGPVANPDAITLAEVNAAENISCYLVRTGFGKTLTQNKITDARVCSAQDFQRFGSKAKDITLTYTFNFHDPDSDQARLTMEEGTDGTLVEVFQVEEGQDEFTAEDWYQATPITLGEQDILPVEDNAIDRIQQETVVSGSWTQFQQFASA